MTPAINQAKKANILYTLHEYHHEASSHSYGIEAAEKLSIAKEQVFKTLVVRVASNELVVALIPVSSMLNMKQIAKAVKAKKAKMADADDVERSTGYVLGGISPLGQKKRLTTVIDHSATAYSTIFVSAGRRGLEIELNPQDLQQLTNATFTAIC